MIAKIKVNFRIICKMLAIILVVYYSKIASVAFCETMETIQDNITLIETIKEILHLFLDNLVRTESFHVIYGKTSIYDTLILGKNFIKTFLDTVDWIQFAEETKNLTIEGKLEVITNRFISYINNILKEQSSIYYQKNAEAFGKAMDFLNNQTKNIFIYLENHKQAFVWFLPLGICYKFGLFDIIPNNVTLLNFPLNLTQMDIMIQMFPHIQYLVQSNFTSLTQIIHSQIITESAWEHFFDSDDWNQIIFNQRKLVLFLGVSVSIIMLKILVS